MNEKNKEFVAKKKWEGWQIGVFLGVIVVMLAAFTVLSILKIMFMVAFLFVLGILSLYYMKNVFKSEYAYTISNKFTVEVLKSGGKRVSVCEFFVSDMTFCGNYYENADKADDVEDFVKAATDVRNDDTYLAVFEKDGVKKGLFFTPNEMMLAELKKQAKCHIA